MCSDKKEIVLGLFQQIEESISLLQQWNKFVVSEAGNTLETSNGNA